MLVTKILLDQLTVTALRPFLSVLKLKHKIINNKVILQIFERIFAF